MKTAGVPLKLTSVAPVKSVPRILARVPTDSTNRFCVQLHSLPGQLVALTTSGRRVHSAMAGDTGLHGHGQNLSHLLHVPDLPMTRLARQVRRRMLRVAEVHELRQRINGTFGHHLLSSSGERSMATCTDGGFGKIGPLPRLGGRMAGGALQFQGSMELMTERTKRERQQQNAATWKRHSCSDARRESRREWSGIRGWLHSRATAGLHYACSHRYLHRRPHRTGAWA